MARRPNTRETVARNLRMLMGLHNPPLDQTELAKRAGVSQKTISNMLDPDRPGISGHNLEKVDQVAKAFGLDAWHLLIPTLPADIEEASRISDLVADYIVAPEKSREMIRHTADREKRLINHDD
jgi:transcriptional regulator with XRE-family HTH domain